MDADTKKRSDALIPMWPNDYEVATGVEVIGDFELRWTANLNLTFQSSRRVRFTLDGVESVQYEDAHGVSSMDLVPDWDAAEPFLDGWVKFDGCYHLNVGRDGYLHLCGEEGMREFVAVLDRVRELARQHTEVE